MKFARWGLLGALLFTIATAAPNTAPMLDPYTIFANARAFWEHQHYPPRLEFTVAVHVFEGGTPKVERYASYFDAVDGVATTDCVSDYERAHPPSGKGVLFNFALPIGGVVIGHSGNPPIDFLGVPEIAPNYSFGIAPFVPSRPLSSQELVAKIRAHFHDPAPATPAPTPVPGSLQQIAVVTARDRHYVITLAGVELLDGTPAYHLKLVPVTQPTRYRLRDLWIDTQSYATRQLVSDGNFTDGPWAGAPWTVRFTQLDGATYIAGETSTQTFNYQNLRYIGAAVDVDDVRDVQGEQLLPYCHPKSNDILSEPTV